MDRYQYSIGDLAARSGIKVPTIRYYEMSNLMPAPPRTVGGQRRYTGEHLGRLQFIRHARELGFPIDDVRELLRLSAHLEAPCQAVDALAAKHLADVEHKIKRLKALRRELKRMIGACGQGCLKSCHIIETLADHSLCDAGH